MWSKAPTSAELLGLARLGQVEVYSITPAEVDLEPGRIIASWPKTKQGSAVPILPQLRPLEQRKPLFVKFAETGKLRERSEGIRILMALEVKFFSRSALAKSEAPTVQVDARLRSATTHNKCRGPLNFMDI